MEPTQLLLTSRHDGHPGRINDQDGHPGRINDQDCIQTALKLPERADIFAS